ncbi:hypothetical protein N431DRAFT_429494 [Stipitochalara longipes BDJ]|nr:hypothetical protein N431DRAFT_429494 [Stipitochalara longipes BDJ]
MASRRMSLFPPFWSILDCISASKLPTSIMSESHPVLVPSTRQTIAVDCSQLGPLGSSPSLLVNLPPRRRSPLRTQTPIARPGSPARETFLVCHFPCAFRPHPYHALPQTRNPNSR